MCSPTHGTRSGVALDKARHLHRVAGAQDRLSDAIDPLHLDNHVALLQMRIGDDIARVC